MPIPTQSKMSSSAKVFKPFKPISSFEEFNRHTNFNIENTEQINTNYIDKHTHTQNNTNCDHIPDKGRASSPYISHPDIDLSLPIYDSYHNIPDDDPYWTRDEIDLDTVYIYDSDEDLSMYDNPPPSTWPTHQISFHPPPRMSMGAPTREGLLEWQVKQGLSGYSALIVPKLPPSLSL